MQVASLRTILNLAEQKKKKNHLKSNASILFKDNTSYILIEQSIDDGVDKAKKNMLACVFFPRTEIISPISEIQI